MIFRHAEHQQIFRVVPIGFAEFPERSADRVHASSGHVHRAESAMRRVVHRAELLRPPTRECLRLIAAGKERELVGICLADVAQPLRRQRQRFFPLDLAELSRAAFADAQQRFRQTRRRIVLHDAGRSLRAQHTFVDRMCGVALDVANAAVFHVHFDAAAARAHIARGRLDLVADRFVDIELRVGHATHDNGCGQASALRVA